MNRNLPLALARRVYARIPQRWRGAARAVGSGPLYSLNTRGIHANGAMQEWARLHPRPVSIVIPSYNDIPLLTKALESIAATCADIEHEVIVVDDYIDAANSEKLKALQTDRVRVVLKDRRLGFSGTVNVGMREARHDIVLLNSDIVAKDGWLEALQYSAYAVDPRIGMVSPKLVYPDGRIQYGGTYYARILAPQWFGHLNVGAPATKPAANVAGYNRSISGACVYITRAAFEQVGVLDDEYWLGFEDVDYGLQAWEAGVRCYYQPAAMLVHHESASRGYSQGRRELASMRKFWRRWQDVFLTRTADAGGGVDLVIGDRSTSLWGAYVDQLAAGLALSGHSVRTHRVIGAGPHEDLIAELSERNSVIVACDWAVAETVWLSTINRGVPVYLLPTIESGAFPTDPERQAAIIAGYRPEFDYIAPDRWAQNQLRAEAAWEARFRVPPALKPVALAATSEPVILTLGADEAARSRVDAIAARSDQQVEHLAAPTSVGELDDIRAKRPRAVVSFTEPVNSLLPLALMSLGAVYLGNPDPRTTYEVLDGYNCLLFAHGDLDALERSLVDVIEHDAVWSEVRENGFATADRLAASGINEAVRALDSFREVSV